MLYRQRDITCLLPFKFQLHFASFIKVYKYFTCMHDATKSSTSHPEKITITTLKENEKLTANNIVIVHI